MPDLSPGVMQLLTLLATAGAIYGGLRADLKSLMQRMTHAEQDIEAARIRMDNHIERSKE
jgi:hypothetical protein